MPMQGGPERHFHTHPSRNSRGKFGWVLLLLIILALASIAAIIHWLP